MANTEGIIKARKVLRIMPPNPHAVTKTTQEITAVPTVAKVAAASGPESSPIAIAAEVKGRNDDATPESAMKALQTAAFNLRVITEGLAALRPAAPSQTGSLLLDLLPQELRDIIWSYALVEPALCDKRHQPDCPFYDPSAPTETPPIELLRGQVIPAKYSWHDDTYFHDEKNARCKELCIRRKGLSLMRVNKQIYEETSPIFWKENMICLFHRRDAVTLLEDHEIQRDFGKVQQVMLWDTHDKGSYSSAADATPFWSLMALMPCLRRLELSDDSVAHVRDAFAVMTSLSEVRLWQFQKLDVDSPRAKLYVGIYRDFRLAPRRCAGRHPNRDEVNNCMQCVLPGMFITSLALRWEIKAFWARHHEYYLEWVAATVAALGQKISPRQKSGAHLLDVCVPTTDSIERVSVWGLPVCSAEERASIAKAREEATSERLLDKWVAQEKKNADKRCENWEMIVEREREMAARRFADQRREKQLIKEKERAEKKKARAEIRAKIGRPPPRGEPEYLDDDEVEVVATKADRRQPSRKQKKSDHEQVLSDRVRNRQKEAAKEAARTRQARKVEAAERRKEKAATTASRKAAAKRVGPSSTINTAEENPEHPTTTNSSARAKRIATQKHISSINAAKRADRTLRTLHDAFTMNEAAWTKAKAAEREARKRSCVPWNHPQHDWRDDEWRKCYQRKEELRHWLYVKEYELKPELRRSRWVERELRLLK